MKALEKVPTGVVGLDDILGGGLPSGRPTLISGGPGSGKTLLAMEFLCRGAVAYSEPGLMVSFEESAADIKTNFYQLNVGLKKALAAKLLHIEHISLYENQAVETGEFTLDALIVRMQKAMRLIGAKRLVLDSFESLISRFDDTSNLRFQFSRIFQWVKDQNITTIITSGYTTEQNAPNKLQEYLSDCAIYMDHRIKKQISKRRLRVIKYRGSSHGTDEYPFLLTGQGISLFPVTTLEFAAKAPGSYVSTGITGLDRMFGGKGMYTGSITLLSGGPGTGKSTVAVNMALATCERGGKSVIFSFEESMGQIIRNMRSVGMDLEPYVNRDLLRILPIRPGRFGLEEHLVRLNTVIDTYRPDTVIIDPVTSFSPIGEKLEILSMLTRLLDLFKSHSINTILTSLLPVNEQVSTGDTAVSSIVDNWVLLLFPREKPDQKRQIRIYKARGMNHSHSAGELILSHSGVLVQHLET